LIHIGDGTSIGCGSQLLGYSVASDRIEFDTIDIGRDCYVGANCVLSINTVIGDGAMLLEQSQLAPGSVIPPRKVASGSPARSSKIDQPLSDVPETTANEPELGGFKFITGFLISGLIFLPLVPFLASIPGMLLLLWIWITPVSSSNALIWIGGLIMAGALFIVSLCILVAGFKQLILPNVKPGEYPLRSMFYLRKWTVDRLVELSLTLNNAQYGTLYLALFLRMLGTQIGARGEISMISNITPELLTIKDEAFIADMASIGPARVYHGMLMVAQITIGKRTFIGNAALAPVGANIPDGCLIGVQSTPPKGVIEPGSTCLGLPPIYLPRRQIVEGFTEDQTYKPGLNAYALRYASEFFRVTLPPAFAYGIFGATLLFFMEGLAMLGPGLLLPLLPFIYLAPAFIATLIVRGAQVVVYRPLQAAH
jgi:non-ribosomal peptide synthetase-like protein